MDVSMKKVIETSYLTAESAAQYRTILRYVYHQHERMQDFITPEEILDYMRGIPTFTDYAEEQLHQQLAQLVKWNNLTARQDMTNAKTIEEYKKKRFRYQPTPYTIEIERMLIVLEKKTEDTFRGSLEKSQFERLLHAIVTLQKALEDKLPNSPEYCTRMWEDILHYFQMIRTSTADYIAYINSEKTDQRMQTEAFLVYKNQFTSYLRDFIVSLQKTSLKIVELLQELSFEQLAPLVEKLIEHRKLIPRLEEVQDEIADWRKEYTEYWHSLRRWFLGTLTQPSELDTLQWQTNEMIRRMTRYVQRIGERQQHFRSRKNDYLHLAKWFANCQSMTEAHMLSSVVFGAMTIRHLQLLEGTTDNLHTDTWDEQPTIIPLKPRTNRYREKTKPGAMTSNSEKKEQQRQQYLAERKKEQALIDQYVNDNRIQLSTLPTIEPYIRKLLLSWIAKSMAAENNMVKTENGKLVKVTLEKENIIVLHSEDGELYMPDAVFEFQVQT